MRFPPSRAGPSLTEGLRATRPAAAASEQEVGGVLGGLQTPFQGETTTQTRVAGVGWGERGLQRLPQRVLPVCPCSVPGRGRWPSPNAWGVGSRPGEQIHQQGMVYHEGKQIVHGGGAERSHAGGSEPQGRLPSWALRLGKTWRERTFQEARKRRKGGEGRGRRGGRGRGRFLRKTKAPEMEQDKALLSVHRGSKAGSLRREIQR